MAKAIIKGAGIAFIVFGILSAIMSVIAVIGSLSGAGALAVSILLLVISVLYILLGFFGVRNCDKSSKGNVFFIIGLALIAYQLVSFIVFKTPFSWQSILGFILPLCYTVGGLMLKKS